MKSTVLQSFGGRLHHWKSDTTLVPKITAKLEMHVQGKELRKDFNEWQFHLNVSRSLMPLIPFMSNQNELIHFILLEAKA